MAAYRPFLKFFYINGPNCPSWDWESSSSPPLSTCNVVCIRFTPRSIELHSINTAKMTFTCTLCGGSCADECFAKHNGGDNGDFSCHNPSCKLHKGSTISYRKKIYPYSELGRLKRESGANKVHYNHPDDKSDNPRAPREYNTPSYLHPRNRGPPARPNRADMDKDKARNQYASGVDDDDDEDYYSDDVGEKRRQRRAAAGLDKAFEDLNIDEDSYVEQVRRKRRESAAPAEFGAAYPKAGPSYTEAKQDRGRAAADKYFGPARFPPRPPGYDPGAAGYRPDRVRDWGRGADTATRGRPPSRVVDDDDGDDEAAYKPTQPPGRERERSRRPSSLGDDGGDDDKRRRRRPGQPDPNAPRYRRPSSAYDRDGFTFTHIGKPDREEEDRKRKQAKWAQVKIEMQAQEDKEGRDEDRKRGSRR
ncbi:hypothetical protein B0T24DRAFT_709803 [Lasiosphaeria ovina]|uniref:Uncharacterized protein n=1 Tax=Lasiosphaeria ovina TaxID=92902 RepID=A0AAE0JZE5_9PEZI|nr:hypothetical protein B0T24DRAFT_709803 [Lasiosphaeria ovina]